MLDQLGCDHSSLSSKTAVQYAFHIYFTSFHFMRRYELCDFTAQLVEHRTCLAEVTDSNPVEALIFFRLLPSNCLNWKFTAMITLHFHLQPQYNMHFIYISQYVSVCNTNTKKKIPLFEFCLTFI